MARRVVAQTSFSWTCGPIHLLAPYEAENTAQTDSPLRGGSIPPGGQSEAGVPYSGVAPIPLHIAAASGWQPQSGTTPLRAQRVLKGKGLIRKKGKTAGVPLLVRPPRAAATFPPAMRGQFRNAFQGSFQRASARSFASLRMTKKGRFLTTKGRAADLTGPLRQRLTALPPPLKGEAGSVVQTASVTRTRGHRRCAFQGESPPPREQPFWGFPRQKSPPPNHSGVSLSLNPRFHPACRPPALPAAPVARNAGGTPRHTAFFRRGAREPVPPSPALRTLPAASSALLQGVNRY